MVFTCERCHSTFSYKSILKSHLQKKNTCEPEYSTEDVNILLNKLCARKLKDKTYDCEFCKKKFNYTSTKSSHKKICKLNPDNQNTVTISKEEYDALKLKQNASIITNNNCTINNIVINNFNQEDIGHLVKRLEYYWANKSTGLIEMSKDIYFDPKHPENHTLNIPNQRNKIIHVRDNGKWIPKDTDETIDEIVYKISSEIEKFINDKEDYLYKKFPDKVDKNNIWWDEISSSELNDKEYKKIVMSLINMVLYNRHIIQ